MQAWETSLFGARTSRKGFWLGLFAYLALLYLAMIPINGIAGTAVCVSWPAHVATTVLLLAISYVFVRTSGRRLHDLGWPGWLAFAFPLLVTLRYEFEHQGANYYCTMGALTPFDGLLEKMLPGPVANFLATWPTFSLTLNGTTIEMASVAFPLMIYLAFFRGQKGANAYGADPIPPQTEQIDAAA